MKKNFFILLVIININLSSINDEESEYKIYDRVYEHFNLNRSEKMRLRVLFEQSDENYVYYSKGSDFFYPKATESEISKLQKIYKNANNQLYYYCEGDSRLSISSLSLSLSSSIEPYPNQANINPLTVKNLQLHVMALQDDSKQD